MKRLAGQRLHQLLDALRTSLWFVPAALVSGALALAVLLITLDWRLGPPQWLPFPLPFATGEEAARATLSTIAASMITVAGVVFSITMVVMALASSQYSPRIIRNFMRDRLSQTALGVFVGVFAYCLLVLSTVGSGVDGSFVPTRAVSVGILSALIGTGFLVLYIHHVARAIQAVHILAAAAGETMVAIEHQFPGGSGDPPTAGVTDAALPDPIATVFAQRGGYIQRVDLETLLDCASRHRVVLRMERRIGDFVLEGSPLVAVCARVQCTDSAAADIVRTVAAAFVIGRFQTVEQDVGYGLRQIVDVATRALSAALNDETSAIQAIDYIGAVLARVAARPLPCLSRYRDGELRVVAQAASFDDLLALGFRQILRAGAASPEILLRVLGALQAILSFAADARRADSVRAYAGLVAAAAAEIVDRERAGEVLRLAHSVQATGEPRGR